MAQLQRLAIHAKAWHQAPNHVFTNFLGRNHLGNHRHKPPPQPRLRRIRIGIGGADNMAGAHRAKIGFTKKLNSAGACARA